MCVCVCVCGGGGGMLTKIWAFKRALMVILSSIGPTRSGMKTCKLWTNRIF